MDGIHKNIKEYNPNKKGKVLIVFDGMIANTVSNKKPNRVLIELFIRGRKLNSSLVFITQLNKDQTKFNTHFCYENSKQKRTLIN